MAFDFDPQKAIAQIEALEALRQERVRLVAALAKDRGSITTAALKDEAYNAAIVTRLAELDAAIAAKTPKPLSRPQSIETVERELAVAFARLGRQAGASPRRARSK